MLLIPANTVSRIGLFQQALSQFENNSMSYNNLLYHFQLHHGTLFYYVSLCLLDPSYNNQRQCNV